VLSDNTYLVQHSEAQLVSEAWAFARWRRKWFFGRHWNVL